MKLALCVKKEDVIKQLPGNGVTQANIEHDLLTTVETTLLDRAVCETDKDYLQIIPYITLFCRNTKRVFIYQRGKASGETRLHGRCSIGLGGHIEHKTEGGDIYASIVTGALRELEEEVGLEFTTERYLALYNKLFTDNYVAYYNWSDDVSSVHLGIMLTLAVNDENIYGEEKDIIDRSMWKHVDEIRDMDKNGEIELEVWSKFVIDAIDMVHCK